MRECLTCETRIEKPERKCVACKEAAGTGTCRSCNAIIVRPPGKRGPLPKVCDECKQSQTRWGLMLPETKAKHAKGVTEYVKRNRTSHREWTRRSYWHRKLKVIELLGGSCAGCGISNPLLLSVNHLDNTRRARADGTAVTLYLAVLASPEPHKHYDLRCMNCQRLYQYETGVLLLPDCEETLYLLDFLNR